jgi:hypothetical protein
MTRRFMTAIGITLAAFIVVAQTVPRLPSQEAASKPAVDRSAPDLGDPKVKVEDVATREDQLKRKYDNFKQALLRLAQRLESSTKQEDRDKAKILKDAIKAASDKGIDTKFTSLISALRKEGTFQSTEDLEAILNQNDSLRQDLRELIEMLLRDDPFARLRAERERTERLLEELKELIAKQERVRAQTEIGRRTNEELRQAQNKVTRQTGDLIGAGKKGEGNEAKNAGASKGTGKGKAGRGEGKDDTSKPKGTERPEGKEGKPGEGKPGEGKPGEGKPGEGKPGEGKPGEGKPGEGKPGEGKPGEGKPGEGKPGEGKPGEGKPGEGKPGEGKPGEGKPGEGKPGEGKPGEGKPGEKKPGEGKPGEKKPSEGKPGEKKASDSKGRSQGKGSPKGSAGESKSGKGGDSKSSGSSGSKSSSSGKSGSSGSSGSSGNQNQQNQDDNPVKKQIQDANKYQQAAENDLDKNNKDDASGNQTKAIDKLRDAQKKLEDLLRQLREEEIERLLAKLQERCQYMLQLQIQVRDGTVALDKVIQENADHKPTRADVQKSNELSDTEDEIIKEANAALRLLEAEGSAVAFAEVFKQVRGDMVNVAARLRKTDTGEITVVIENDIIETLGEMVDALKKARQQNKSKPKPGQPGQQGQPQDQKLIDMIAELKMIRSMQLRVNRRTKLYGDQYKGEQAPPVETGKDETAREQLERIHRELKELSERQQKISRVTDDIAKGKNEKR